MITCWPSVTGPSSSAAPVSSLAPRFTVTGFGRPSSPPGPTGRGSLGEGRWFPAPRPRRRASPVGPESQGLVWNLEDVAGIANNDPKLRRHSRQEQEVRIWRERRYRRGTARGPRYRGPA